MVIITLVQWEAVAVGASIVQTQAQFYVLAVSAGSGLGSVQAASRALFTSLVPAGTEAHMFGFYALCGKGAASG